MTDYDLVVRGGTVVDGTGMPAYRADVAVDGDRIVRIGRVPGRGAEEVDATGLVVTPGFIDGHTHMDAQVFWDESGSCSCWHGVTTVVMGNCGFTIAPVRSGAEELAVRSIERSEDISAAAMAAGVPWGWSTFASYLDALDAVPKGINYAANIGHSALRTFVMGERGFHEPSTDDELDAMRTELGDALRAGAWGFSTSRTVHHMTPAGDPVASRAADWHEVVELVRTMGALGVGTFQMVEDPPTPERRAERDAELVRLAAESGVPFLIGATGSSSRPIELIQATLAAGGRMTGMTHPRGIGTMSSFRSQLPFDSIPEWAEARAAGEDAFVAALRDPTARRRLVAAARDAVYADTFGGEARPPDFERMRVLDSPVPPHRTVAEVAAERGVHPVEAMIDLALEADLDLFFVQNNLPFDTEAVRDVMRSPHTVMTFSDAGAHVSQMSDASIFTHFLAHWVRDRADFSLEEGVRMMTLAPARAWGFADRGLVREGLVADLNVFDPETVAPAMPRLVHDLPSGAPRIVQGAVGIAATIVAGCVTLRDGQATGSRPGRLLRGPLAAMEEPR